MTEALLRKLGSHYGGSIPFARAATLLGISERVLMQRMVANEVLAIDFDNQFHFPMFQFHGMKVVPGLSSILKSFKAPPEEIVDILLEEFMGGKTPVDLLREGITEVEMYALTEALTDYFKNDLAPSI